MQGQTRGLIWQKAQTPEQRSISKIGLLTTGQWIAGLPLDKMAERENSDQARSPKGGERSKFCSPTNSRSAVTHILKKKGFNSVKEESLAEALLSQRGTLSLWPSVTIPDPHTDQGKVLRGSPGLHLDPSPPLCPVTGRIHCPGLPHRQHYCPSLHIDHSQVVSTTWAEALILDSDYLNLLRCLSFFSFQIRHIWVFCQ